MLFPSDSVHFTVCPNPAPDMEEYGPGEKALRAAAAAAAAEAASREGNPKKLRGAVGNETSSPGVYLLRTYFSITPLALCSFLNLSVAASSCNLVSAHSG